MRLEAKGGATVRPTCSYRICTAPTGPAGSHYRCLAGEVEFVAEDDGKGSICNGCTIPGLMAGEHCLYLEPVKRFFQGKNSVVVLHCTKLDFILPDLDYCQLCSTYTCFNGR